MQPVNAPQTGRSTFKATHPSQNIQPFQVKSPVNSYKSKFNNSVAGSFRRDKPQVETESPDLQIPDDTASFEDYQDISEGSLGASSSLLQSSGNLQSASQPQSSGEITNSLTTTGGLGRDEDIELVSAYLA